MDLKILTPLLNLVQEHGSQVSVDKFVAVMGHLLNDPVIYLTADNGEFLASFGQEIDMDLPDHLLIDNPDSDELQHSATRQKPIIGKGRKLGSLIVIQDNPLTQEEEVLLECASTLLGVFLADQAQGLIDVEEQQRRLSNSALESLTYSELIITKQVLTELAKENEDSHSLPEGLVIASKIADDMGIARSVIVNAIRKLQSAGVIEARSLGMKGTRLRVVNPQFMKAIEQTPLPDSA